MEDTHRVGYINVKERIPYFTVCDGHAGAAVAKELYTELPNALQRALIKSEFNSESIDERARASFARRNVDANDRRLARARIKYPLREEFATLNSKMSRFLPTGSCAIIVWIKDGIHVANVGDSRAVLCRNEKATDLSRDAKVGSWDDARVEKDGGTIYGTRISGIIAVARAFGNYYNCYEGLAPLKGLTTSPQIVSHPFPNKDEKNTLVIACDGLWDCFTSAEVAQFIQQHHDKSLEEITRLLQAEVQRRDGFDNLTIILVDLNRYIP